MGHSRVFTLSYLYNLDTEMKKKKQSHDVILLFTVKVLVNENISF